jgi:hypothetical protein
MVIISKRTLLVIIIGVVILGSFLFLLFYFYIPTKNKNNHNIQSKGLIYKEGSDNGDYQVSRIKPLKKQCENIDNKEKKECLDNYIFNIASLKNNIFECSKIANILTRDQCILMVIKNNREQSGKAEKDCDKIATKEIRDKCFIYLAIHQINNNNLCEKKNGDEPFELKECQDKRTAMQIENKIKNVKSLKERARIIEEECRPNLTLEYHTLCIEYGLNLIDFNCDLFDSQQLKDYCQTFKINKLLQRSVRNCNLIPLEDYRYVCLKEIELQKDRFEFDTDGDGLSDGTELFYNLDIFSVDTDGDGLSDKKEIYQYHSNPKDKDTDQDGLNDKEEIADGTDINNPDTDDDNILDGQDNDPLNRAQDKDGDYLTDEEEAKWGTDPNKKDTDGDGVSDWEEIQNGTNPVGDGWQHDADNDGLIDADERFYGTDPLNSDTDGDGYQDGEEVKAGFNPAGEGKLNNL